MRKRTRTNGRTVLARLLADHRRLREQLREWEAALQEVRGSSYGHCQHAVSVLRDLCRVVEHDLRPHLREEETVLYALVEFKLPRLRGLVEELRAEHDVFRQGFEHFRRQLVHFNTSGKLEELPPLGRELVRHLRRHLEREERELHPVVRREFGEEDWRELRLLHVDSEVA